MPRDRPRGVADAQRSAIPNAAGLVWETMQRCLDTSDAELLRRHGDLHNEEDLALPQLLLMHTLMTRRLHVGRVTYVRTMGNCEGVLRADDMWPYEAR